ncbi:ABC transporter permease [Agromyces badenianii]|uniref:ABC transporter permease n=1 Tax=Agromyces badenianii TaxID=2080742 RepID=UPI001F3AE8DC|nr:ABC transporter permease [Agromyces badenianii]
MVGDKELILEPVDLGAEAELDVAVDERLVAEVPDSLDEVFSLVGPGARLCVSRGSIVVGLGPVESVHVKGVYYSSLEPLRTADPARAGRIHWIECATRLDDMPDDASAEGERSARLLAEPMVRVGRTPGTSKSTIASIKEIWAYRQLLGLLVGREVRGKYKNSSLGIVWSLMRPLAQLLIYFIAIGQFLGAARSIPDFAIFVFTGLTAWGLYSEIISAGTTSILANGGLVKKVYLPREIFPLAAVGAALFNFVIQLAILVVATIVLGVVPFSLDLLYVPASIVLILVVATAIALALAALNVYLRDIQHLVEIILLVLFWASPIVYSFGLVHSVLQGSWLEEVYLANPITLAVIGMQKGMWVAGSADTTQYWPPGLEWRMLIATLVGVVLLWVGQRIFSRLQGNFAQEL